MIEEKNQLSFILKEEKFRTEKEHEDFKSVIKGERTLDESSAKREADQLKQQFTRYFFSWRDAIYNYRGSKTRDFLHGFAYYFIVLGFALSCGAQIADALQAFALGSLGWTLPHAATFAVFGFFITTIVNWLVPKVIVPRAVKNHWQGLHTYTDKEGVKTWGSHSRWGYLKELGALVVTAAISLVFAGLSYGATLSVIASFTSLAGTAAAVTLGVLSAFCTFFAVGLMFFGGIKDVLTSGSMVTFGLNKDALYRQVGINDNSSVLKKNTMMVTMWVIALGLVTLGIVSTMIAAKGGLVSFLMTLGIPKAIAASSNAFKFIAGLAWLGQLPLYAQATTKALVEKGLIFKQVLSLVDLFAGTKQPSKVATASKAKQRSKAATASPAKDTALFLLTLIPLALWKFGMALMNALFNGLLVTETLKKSGGTIVAIVGTGTATSNSTSMVFAGAPQSPDPTDPREAYARMINDNDVVRASSHVDDSETVLLGERPSDRAYPPVSLFYKPLRAVKTAIGGMDSNPGLEVAARNSSDPLELSVSSHS